jgi:hypothetical protein
MRQSARFVFLLLCFAACSAIAKDEPKLVSVGSQLPRLGDLKENITLYEEQAPFDGVSVHVGLSDVFNPEPFSDAAKDQARANGKLFKQIRFAKWKYNFLAVLIDQRKPLWFDEGYWTNVARNWALAAKFAKQIGMVGICLDPEGYGVYPVQSHWRSSWWMKTEKTTHTEKEYLDIARKRGQQVGEAVFKEFPEIVLWGYYAWSFGADLMGAFCNGILDVIPPKAKLVDGDEWSGYCAKSEAAYDRMADRNKTGCGMLDKRLLSKHKAQGGFAPAFYMDAYARPEASQCLIPDINKAKSKMHFFKDNMKCAKRKATGGHIWIYGEKNTWWTPPEKALREMAKSGKKPTPTWEEAIPGIREVLFGDRLEKIDKSKRKK